MCTMVHIYNKDFSCAHYGKFCTKDISFVCYGIILYQRLKNCSKVWFECTMVQLYTKDLLYVYYGTIQYLT